MQVFSEEVSKLLGRLRRRRVDVFKSFFYLRNANLQSIPYKNQ
jgi:hypothetical protein